MSKVKIICTIGPSSGNALVLRSMRQAGMDVARLNFSHGSHEMHRRSINFIRGLNKTNRRRIKILQDLEGYRIRIGKFKSNKKTILLKKGQEVALTNKEEYCKPGTISFDYQGSLNSIGIGCHIYIDDGNIAIKVKSRTKDYINGEVVSPGILKENKGVNIPAVNFEFHGLTDKDKTDLQFGIKNKVDFIAQSFVRDKEDIVSIRKFIEERSFKCKLIAKIENRQGIENLDSILGVCDGIMIARGDMGVSLPIYEVPIMQKMIIRKCNERRKFVITATQMLESMTEHLRPTRAEVSDVANAILDGSDYVMLSGETAVGQHPVEVVRMMSDIIKFTEKAK